MRSIQLQFWTTDDLSADEFPQRTTRNRGRSYRRRGGGKSFLQLRFPWTAENPLEEKLRDLLEFRGLTISEAAKILGKSNGYIMYVSNKFSIHRQRIHRAKKYRDEIYQRRLAGESFVGIARDIGCAVRTVQNICRDYERHLINADLGIDDDGPFTRQVWGDGGYGDDDDESTTLADIEPREVKPYRCPVHGIVKFRPCIACMAER